MNKLSILALSSMLLCTFNTYAASCEFKEKGARPKWVGQQSDQSLFITAVGVEQYNNMQHRSLFDFRKQSELRAREAFAVSLQASVYSQILNNKSLKEKRLVKRAESMVSQVSEMVLPETRVSGRWIDIETCMLWTKIDVESEIVADYVDEVREMEAEVLFNLDKSTSKSVLEALNAKQFYLNYSGFVKALNSQSKLTHDGKTKNVLTWMIESGYDIFEPSNVESGSFGGAFWIPGHTNSLIYYMLGNEISLEQFQYVFNSIKAAGLNPDELKTEVISEPMPMGAHGKSGKLINIYMAPGSIQHYPLIQRLTYLPNQLQQSLPSVSLELGNQTTFQSGGYTLLHIATQFRRADIVDWLLKQGMNPNTQDILHFTPAQYAVVLEDRKLLQVFLKRSKALPGVYLTAIQVSKYKANLNLDIMQSYSGMSGVAESFGLDLKNNTITSLKNDLIKNDKASIEKGKANLIQSIRILEDYKKVAVDPKFTDKQFEENIGHLKSLL
ncbi:MAG: hypothetical protein GYB23_03560 [Vibrionaceae bacterium]|nr:hypothetical protein [Vibrionaceae bacterium]